METRAKARLSLLIALAVLPLSGFGNSAASEWTWVSGSNSINQSGIYGTIGMGAPTNAPGARVYASSWTDPSGDRWLFGGYGFDSTGNQSGGDLNDLWKYSNGQWTWMSGSNVVEQPGTYGTLGIPAPGNVPGARYEAVSWTDASGNLWLFGGLGLSSQSRGYLNDLWKYNAGEWTWVSGSDVCCQKGIYGTQGKSEPANVPGARVDSSSWTDHSGNLWFFGGFGYDSTGTLGILNDLWKFSNGEWTWMSGADVVNQFGRYGKKGTAASDNAPGSRANATEWIDATDNLWLFGGQGNDVNGKRCRQTGGPCELNDLWKYSGGKWTWMSGSNVVQQPGTYGTRGVAGPDNVPGARDSGLGWTDANGDFWLFGGFGFDSASGAQRTYGDLNDLWKYSAGQWTWIRGSREADQLGRYGTQGTAAPGNVPGARDGAVGWVDGSGNLWLFGGGDYRSTAPGGKFNDQWEYQPRQ
jgi:hypothetical protein